MCIILIRAAADGGHDYVGVAANTARPGSQYYKHFSISIWNRYQNSPAAGRCVGGAV